LSAAHGARAETGGEKAANPGSNGTARVLVTEPLSESGLALLARAGLAADVRTDLNREALLAAIGDYDALVVRSATQVDRQLLDAGKKLRVVGRAGVGLDNVDVKAATERGVLVVNAPSGNVVSAAEHTIALLLSLLRRVPEAQVSLKAGEWKRSKFVGTELQGKTVGLVGLGQVGARVAARLAPWGVRLLAFDPYISDERAAELGVVLSDLDDLLSTADVVSLHTPVTPETTGLMNAERFSRMKDGAFLVNCARGALVDEAALLQALDSGRLAGAALDVFAAEPPKDFTLAKHPKVVVTPHLGASTVEAQDRVATETVEMLVEALAGSPFVAAVNLPFPAGGDPHAALPWMRLAEQAGEFVGQALHAAPVRIGVALAGVPEAMQRACVVAAVKGVLTPFCAEGVNLVNAQTLAKNRGVGVTETLRGEGDGYANLITVTVATARGERSASATLFSDRHGRIVAVDGLPLEFTPEGTLLVITNRDVPGVVGRIGTLLGERRVNICDFALARGREGHAAAVVRIDPPGEGGGPPGLVEAVGRLEGIESVRLVTIT
jgi:D-3-phosphoglycerate dehydrogenase